MEAQISSQLDLSSTQIPSGYLLDYSLSAFNDSNYNGILKPTVDTLKDYGSFFFIHGAANASKVNANANINPIGSTYPND